MRIEHKTKRLSRDHRAALVAALSPLLPLLDPERCLAALLAEFHPDGPRCPDCKAELTGKPLAAWWAGRRTSCGGCGRQFFPWEGTPAKGLHATPPEIVLFRAAVAAGLDRKGLQELLGRGPQGVENWMARFCGDKKSPAEAEGGA